MINFKKLFGLGTSENEEKPESSAPIIPGLPPAPQMRERVFGFIVEKLSPYKDGGTAPVAGLKFYALCESNEEEALLSETLYVRKPDEFRNKLQQELLNNYIKLPQDWVLTCEILRTKLPDCQYIEGTFGMDVVSSASNVGSHPKATLTALEGQLAQEEYKLAPQKQQKYLIGRTKSTGTIRMNDIYFSSAEDENFDPEKGEANGYVSHNHARILYYPDRKKYFLTADEGGLPMSENKTRIYKHDESIVRVEVLGMKYELEDGDQIQLGEKARLLFKVITDERG